MDEYIRRGAAIEETCSDCTERNICGGSCSDTDRLRAIPAADVVDVRRGRWVDERYVWQGLKSAQCNQCKRKTDYYIQPEYCPHGGAKMDGGKNA